MEQALLQISEVLKSLQDNQDRITNLIASQHGQNRTGEIKGGNLQPYDEENETFTSYLQRLQNFLDLRNLKDNTEEGDKKCVQILINCLGPKHYQLLTSLTAPELPNTQKFKELIDLLRDHISPKPSEISEQHRFSCRIQHEGESIAKFQAELKQLSTNCNFKCTECGKPTINTHLRTQFIKGVRDNDTREKLLQSSKISFEEAVKIALSIEAAKLESKELQGTKGLNYIQKIQKDNNSDQRNNLHFKKEKKGNGNKAKSRCFRCGKPNHLAANCKAKKLKCRTCGKDGHVEIVCFGKKRAVQQIEVEEEQDEEESFEREEEEEINYINPVYSIEKGTSNADKFKITILIEGKPCTMELDTGAALSIISYSTFKRLCPHLQLQATATRLRTYTGEIIKPKGTCVVRISYKRQSILDSLYVLDGKFDSIFGRNWLRKIKINWKEIHQIKDSGDNLKLRMNQLITEYDDIFNSELGEIPNIKCSLKVSENATPIFIKPRPIPYAIRHKIEEEIKRLEKLGIIEKTDYSTWGSPIVPVIKKDGQVRLCADYKVTINKFIMDDNYPIPRIEDLFARLSGGKFFATLDISQAYLHMKVDDDSAVLQTISTHWGTYKVKRLMFGVKIAPNIWQRFMDQMLQDLKGVICFFDDILVQGSTEEEFLGNIEAVLQKLRNNGLHLKKEKCQFLLESITYLGHKIDEFGLHPTQDKVTAIVNSSRPTNVSEVRTFLGLINYYQKFLPNVSTKLAPIYALLKENTRFKWSKACDKVFLDLKKEIASDRVLTPYNPNLPLSIATDASPTGLGAVISHTFPDGVERPIAFASRSLTKAETNYSQIDKEATAIVWGLKKFFLYCYGRPITLITDHKPLTRIFHPSKDLPATSAIRLLHYANFMSGFKYDIKYRNTKSHANADYLSRFSLHSTQQDRYLDVDSVYFLNQIETLPVSREEIRKETLKDLSTMSLYRAIQSGKELSEDELSKYSIENGCILRGIRVVIPKPLQQRILEELHIGHTGIVKMKNLARSYVWWKGIDRDIEAVTRYCRKCCMYKNNPVKQTPVHPWEYPSQPWQRIHVDYAGPFKEKYFLIIVDAYSKYPEVHITNNIDTRTTIHRLRETFARFGIPVTLVSDNGTCFTSREFKEFLSRNGIKHKLIAPYHPATNGQAERYVQIVKQGLRTMTGEGDLPTNLCRLLMQYRRLPHSETNQPPAELIFKHHYRTRLDLIRRDLQMEKNDRIPLQPVSRSFQVGDPVQARFYNNKDERWKIGEITQKHGKLHYEIEIDDEKHRRHQDQLLRSEARQKPSTEIEQTRSPELPAYTGNTGDAITDKGVAESPRKLLPEPKEEVELRRSTRIRRAPNRLNL